MTGLERLMVDAGLTVGQVADRVGVRHGAVRYWLNGECVPSTLNAARLAEVLGVTRQRLDEEVVAARAMFKDHGRPKPPKKRRKKVKAQ